MFPRVVASVLAVVVCATGGEADVVARRATERVFVTVLDDRGGLVNGLGAADFKVEIDGRPQEIISAQPAIEPPSVVILTDQLGLTPTYTNVDIRLAMTRLVGKFRGVAPAASFALMTFDGPVRLVTNFKTAPALLDRALSRLNGVSPDSVFLDAVVEASRALSSAPSERRIIFTVISAYRPDQSSEQSDVVGTRLRQSRASLWVVEAVQDVIRGGNSASPSREAVLESGTRLSGGARATVTNTQALDSAVQGIAGLVLGQYEVAYGPGASSANSRLRVELTRPVGRLLAPGWGR